MDQSTQTALNTLQAFKDSLDLSTSRLVEIFKTKGLISEAPTILESAPFCEKLAIAAAIIQDVKTVMHEAQNTPSTIQVAMQLGKVGDKMRLALPGGAILSAQEQIKIERDFKDKEVPANLFYHIAQEQLHATGQLQFDYPEALVGASFTASLRQNLVRELGEEISLEAVKHIAIETILPEERVTVLRTMGLPDREMSQVIAENLAARGVSINDQDKLEGVYTIVTDKVAVVSGPVRIIEAMVSDNEEAFGVKVFTLAELVEISANTAESDHSYSNYRSVYNAEHDGIRNPSTTWGLSLLVDWLINKIQAAG